MTPTPTEDFCDGGYYVLDNAGSLNRVGNPPEIVSSLFFGDDVARDLERADATRCGGGEDLVMLDKFGIATFAANDSCNIDQYFYFPESSEFPEGRAVDLVMSGDSQGFWVLTDYGRIYRAGSAMVSGQPAKLVIPAIDGMLGWDIPTPLYHPSLPDARTRGASLRAVSLIVIDLDADSQADGYLVFDSQGARYQVNPDGTLVLPGTYTGMIPELPANHPYYLLDPAAYAWPFFPGLDILRDAELFPGTNEGLVIFDGWGGIHPVPVDATSSAVFYARNDDFNQPGDLLTTVGMPYIIWGFDDPATPVDESVGVDASSIFIDFEFSPGCPESGFWTLDRFGAVFCFGSVRSDPANISSPFAGGPYLFPFPSMVGLEVFEQK